MVNSKTELLQVSNAWLSEAKQDLSRHLKAFANKVRQIRGVSNPIPMIADMLGERPEVIQAVIEGRNIELPLSFFAKLLVATGHVIRIEPIEEAPRQVFAPRQAQPRPAAPHHVPFGRPTPPFGRPAPVREERVYNPATDQFQTPPRSARPEQAMAPHPMMGMPPMGFPMPNPGCHMPSPEEFEAMERARHDAAMARAQNMPRPDFGVPGEAPFNPQDVEEFDNNELPETFENENIEADFMDPANVVPPMEDEYAGDDNFAGDDAEDDTTRLVNALRQHPEVANLLRNMLG